MRMQMEKSENRRRRNGRFAAAMAVMMLLIALMAQPGFAEPLVINGGTVQGGTIKVLPPENYDVLKGNASFDVYKIADAVPVEGHDTFAFANFVSGAEYYENNLRNAENVTAAAINGFAQVLAADAKAGKIAPYKTGTVGDPEFSAKAGMYMLIMHGSGSDYWKTADSGEIITGAEVEGKQYFFVPTVVSLPTNKATNIDAGSETYTYEGAEITSQTWTANTAGPEDWIYNIQVTPKVGLKPDSPTPTPAKVTLNGLKCMEGRDLKENEFTFRLTIDGKTVGTARNTKDENDPTKGIFTFKELTYDTKGTHIFTVAEVAGNDRTVTYDKTIYTGKIVITDGGEGQLKAAVSVDEPKANTGIVFTNKYTPPTPTPTRTVTPPPGTPTTPGNNTTVPVKTGDSSHFIIWLIILLAAIAAAIVAIIQKKKNKL